MRKKYKRNIFLILIAIITITIIIGYQTWNKPHRDIKNANAIKTTSIALYKDLTKDSVNMKSIFINKIVAVLGEVKQISKNKQNQQIILLKTNVPQGSVNCTMEENIINIKVGDMVNLKGICLGYTGGDLDIGLPGDVFLIRCYGVF